MTPSTYLNAVILITTNARNKYQTRNHLVIQGINQTTMHGHEVIQGINQTTIHGHERNFLTT